MHRVRETSNSAYLGTRTKFDHVKYISNIHLMLVWGRCLLILTTFRTYYLAPEKVGERILGFHYRSLSVLGIFSLPSLSQVSRH